MTKPKKKIEKLDVDKISGGEDKVENSKMMVAMYSKINQIIEVLNEK
jgi:hypothetical protein